MDMQEIQSICTQIYLKSEPHGYFPALTGGFLYKDGPRKDVDIVMYEKRDEDGSSIGYLDGLLLDLEKLGFWFKESVSESDNPPYFVYKAIFRDEVLFDFLFPGNYLSDGPSYSEEESDKVNSDWEVRFAEIICPSISYGKEKKISGL